MRLLQEVEVLWAFWESRAGHHRNAASSSLQSSASTDSPTTQFVKTDAYLATEIFATVPDMF